VPSSGARARSACQGFSLAEIGGPSPRLFAPIVEVATGDRQVQSSGYGSGAGATPELPVVAVVDETSGQPVPNSLVAREPGASTRSACILPRAAAVANGALYVACMGIDAIVEYGVPGDGSLPSERRRWTVPSGPTGIAIHGRRAVVWSQFGSEATILSLGGDALPVVVVGKKERALTAEEEVLSLGRKLFHASGDRRVSSDGRACASCHPDGRDDGLVWSTPGGPRQTPMLAGRLVDTAPYGWDGAGSDVAHHLDHTLARLEGQGLPPRDLDALARYVATLQGPTVKVEGAEEVRRRGSDLFLSSGCGSCHGAESAWTDGHRHEVGSRVSGDATGSFDTPSLRFVAGTAPYFHDGRYPTLHALLTKSPEPMGAAKGLPEEDLAALEAFVRSL